MLKKINRLTSKDINFLFKKQSIIHWKFFSFFYFFQYPNKKYNQYSVQISLKFSKKTVLRTLIKRILYNHIKNKDYVSSPYNNKFYKIFVITNKATNDFLKKLVETKDKKHIKEEIKEMFDISFKNLSNKLWTNL